MLRFKPLFKKQLYQNPQSTFGSNKAKSWVRRNHIPYINQFCTYSSWNIITKAHFPGTVSVWVTPGKTAGADTWKQFFIFFLVYTDQSTQHQTDLFPYHYQHWHGISDYHYDIITQGLQSLQVCVSTLLGTSRTQHLGCQSLIIQCSAQFRWSPTATSGCSQMLAGELRCSAALSH